MLTDRIKVEAGMNSAPPFDLGIFGPSSKVWRLHAKPLGLVGGIRALIIQSTEPRSLAGVVQHSHFKTDPLGRFSRTAEFIGVTTYGERLDVERAVRRVLKVHESVVGVDPVTGLDYDANDPILLAFVHNALVESIATTNRYCRPLLRASTLDSYVSEMARLGTLMGVPDQELPRTYRDVVLWVERFPTLTVSEYTLMAFEGLRSLPVEDVIRPAWELAVRAATATLPRWIKAELGVKENPLEDLAVLRATAAGSLLLGLILPESPSIASARDRLHENRRYRLDRARAAV